MKLIIESYVILALQVALIPRRRGNLVEYATPSLYSGGSAAASPQPSQNGQEVHSSFFEGSIAADMRLRHADSFAMQVNDLREAIADKDLLIMELREEKAQLQVLASRVLRDSACVITGSLSTDDLQMDTSQAEGSWQAALQHKDWAIQQLSQALQSKEQALVTMSQRDAAWQRSPSQTAQQQQAHDHDMDQLRSQLAEHNATIAALRARLTRDSNAPDESAAHAPDDIPDPQLARTGSSRAAQPNTPRSARRHSTADPHDDPRASGSAMSLVRLDTVGSGAAAHVDVARMAPQHATDQSTPRSRRSDAENAAFGWPARQPLQPVPSASGLQTEATFHPAHAPQPAGGSTLASLRHELLANVRRAQEAVGQLQQEGRRGEARLQGLLREQETLLQGAGEGGGDDGFGERFRSVLEERLREASTRAHIVGMEVCPPGFMNMVCSTTPSGRACACAGAGGCGCSRGQCHGHRWRMGLLSGIERWSAGGVYPQHRVADRRAR